MQENSKSFEELAEIKSLMMKSTRFLSLSGLSGVAAGIVALICTYIALLIFKNENGGTLFQSFSCEGRYFSNDGLKLMIVNGVSALALAILFGFYFTWRKARKNSQKVFTPVAIKMFIHLGIPLFVGGIFVFASILYSDYYLIAPLTLIFYGMALLNGSRHTIADVRYLGLSEILIGLIALFLPGYGLLFWVIGFGLLHIIYGTAMHFKYDR
ncbi:MAG: hypothetical protein HN381_01135 [Bacteroidetes bacterium]|nr:hypothetical protein [Bacteroidota bacterium]